MADAPFNPLDKLNLGQSVAGALLKRPVGPLPPGDSFNGAGIYAIYYTGHFRPYRLIRDQNIGQKYERPIYVGKAVPKGAMKGGFGLDKAPGNVLFSRIREHSRSINEANNLDLRDFQCKFLVADDIWIPLGESLLIEWFHPVWNVVLQGFGNHPTGIRRETQYRSLWDTVHPGRPWATRLPPNPKQPEELLKLIAEFLAGKVPPLISPEQAVTEEEQET